MILFSSKSLKKEMKLFKALKAKLVNLLQRWESFKSIKSVIEDVFKLTKSFSLRRLHRYTIRLVYKFVAFNVLLVSVVVALGFKEKKALQKLAEMLFGKKLKTLIFPFISPGSVKNDIKK